MTDPERFIVAEVSMNWLNGEPAALDRFPGLNTIARRFEHVIAVNLERGYILRSFQLHRLMTGADELNETIVAVFERERRRVPR